MPIDDALIEREILAALARRDPESSVCPSEVARLLMPASCSLWRTLMPRVRAAAVRLAQTKRVTITRGKAVVPLDDLSGGPIRIRRGICFDA